MSIKVNKQVVEEATFSNEGTFEAYWAAVAWARGKGFEESTMSHPLPTALVKGSYEESDLPEKWKNFKPRHAERVDGTITGDFREGPVVVRLFVP